MTRLTEIVIGSTPEPWQRIGFPVVDDVVRIGAVALRLDPSAEGIASWGLAGWPDGAGPSELDGLLTFDAPPAPGPAPDNAIGAPRLELISIQTESMERTAAAISAATGEPIKGVQGTDAFRVGYIRLGEALAEVVQSPRAPQGPAAFGGLILVVEDLESVSATLGPDLISEVRIAVQYGRRIATFRPTIGLGTPVAAMTPPPDRPPTPDQLREWGEMRSAARGR